MYTTGDNSIEESNIDQADQTVVVLPTAASEEENFRTVFEHVAVGIAVFGPSGRIVHANEALSRIVGYSVDEILGMSCRDFTHADDRAAESQGFGRVFNGETASYRLEKRCIRKDGSTAWLDVSVSRFPGSETEQGCLLAVVLDITERKRAEMELRFTQFAIDRSSVAAFWMDEETRLIYVNDSACELLGYKKPELLALPVSEFVPRQNPQTWARFWEDVRRDGSLAFDTIFRHRDGRVLSVECRCNYLTFDGREYACCSAVDITERKQVARALARKTKELEDRLTQQECLYAISSIMNRDTESFPALLQEAVERIPSGFPAVKKTVARLVLGKEQFQSSGFLPFGSRLTENLTVGGEIRGFIDLRRDGESAEEPDGFSPQDRQLLRAIAEIVASAAGVRAAREAVERSEAHFRSLIENACDLTLIMDAEARIQYISPAAIRVLGYVPEQVLGRCVFEVVHPDDRQKLEQTWLEAVHSLGISAPVQYRVRRADGTWVYLESMANNRLFDPAVNGLVINSRDISERKALEEGLHQAQKMQAIGQLAGGVAHDFNNALTVILGTTELLLENAPAASEQWEDLSDIKQAGERASALTRQLLAFSRKQTLQPEQLDLNAVVADLLKMLGRLLGEDIRILTDFAPDLGLVKADPTQLQQVLLNLASNARDAMPNGGTLMLRTANTHLDPRTHPEAQKGDYVLLSVSDEGCGMSPEVSAHIFEPFYTTKARGKGTGLGLATVYGIVKQSGGEITVSSREGVGTTFRIYLPRCREERVSLRPVESPLVAGTRRETVLLVEDEELVRKVARRMLEAEGYRVLVAEDGISALETIDTCRDSIDLLVSDVVMPFMSGTELVRKACARRLQLRALFVSGYVDKFMEQRGVAEVAVPFLQKPYSQASFLNKVREVLDMPELEWAQRAPKPLSA